MSGSVVVTVCAALNIAGVRVVSTTSLWLFFLLSAPFVLIVILAPFKYAALLNAVTTPTTSKVNLVGGVLVAMWNYMGWDNASTIAEEVDRPQRTYPLAMLLSVTIVAVSYMLPVGAVWITKLPASAWETGSWADIAGLLGGPLLRIALVIGGMVSAFGMFNALVLSYSRLPLSYGTGWHVAPSFREIASAHTSAMGCDHRLRLRLGTLSGPGIRATYYNRHSALRKQPRSEFIALILLRVREPELPRAFRVPGGMFGAIAVGIFPIMLLGFSVIQSESERVWGMSSFALGMILIAAGVAAYFVNGAIHRDREPNT